MMKKNGTKIIFALSILLAILLGMIGGLYAAPFFEGAGSQKGKAPPQEESPDIAPDVLPSNPPPKPDTEPPADSTLDALQEALDLFFIKNEFDEGDKWAVYVTDAESEKTARKFYQVGENEKMIAASLIKIFIAGAVYAEAEQNNNFIIGVNTTAGIKTMLRDSDNNSANELIKALGDGDDAKGFQKVNAFADGIGCPNTRLNRRLLDQNADDDNFTTVSDCARALRLIAEGAFVSEAASKEIEAFLLADSDTNRNKDTKIRAGVYKIDIDKTAKVANKTGENIIPCVIENDIAIVSFGGRTRYIICIMSNSGNTAVAKEAIRELAGITHEVFLSEE